MKYFSRPVTMDGIRFDSQSECDYYLMLKSQGAKDLVIHPRYVLQKAFDKPDFDGTPRHYAEIGYEADFQYTDEHGRTRVVDVKGYPDEAFPIHRKLFEAEYPRLHLEAVKYAKSTGWVKLDDYKDARRAYKAKLRAERNEAQKRAKELERLESDRKRKSARLKELEAIPAPNARQKRRIETLRDELLG
jgi:hypothetical protein